MASLIVARHAPPMIDGICYGRSDVPTELDPAQAALALLEALPNPRFDRVWSSPSERCIAPARLVASRLALPLSVDERLLELDFGQWEGRRWHEIESHDRAAFARWMDDWRTARPPGGESVPDLEARVRAWFEALEPGRHLLVGHAGVIRALRVVGGRCDWHVAMERPVVPLVPEIIEV
jgi:alpha-ribazole phosphatase